MEAVASQAFSGFVMVPSALSALSPGGMHPSCHKSVKEQRKTLFSSNSSVDEGRLRLVRVVGPPVPTSLLHIRVAVQAVVPEVRFQATKRIAVGKQLRR